VGRLVKKEKWAVWLNRESVQSGYIGKVCSLVK